MLGAIERPTPQASPGEVRIRMHAARVNPEQAGSLLYLRFTRTTVPADLDLSRGLIHHPAAAFPDASAATRF